MVHPRDLGDLYRQYPLLRFFGSRVAAWIGCLLPPVRLSSIRINGSHAGDLYSHCVIPDMMRRFPRWTLRVSRAAVMLAAKDGAEVIGLGALIPGITRGGALAQSRLRHARVTTGHAYTAAVVTQRLQELAVLRGLPLPRATVAICGAAGSTGSATARALAAALGDTLGSLLLIDQRLRRVKKLSEELQRLSPGICVTESSEMQAMRQADYSIIVTSAIDTIVRSEFLKPGAVLIDDSQPRNTDPALLDCRTDIIVADVLAEVPGLEVEFDWGLLPERPSITFTCLAETIALAQSRRGDVSVIGTVSSERIAEVDQIARRLGIGPAPLTSFYQLMATATTESAQAGTLSRGNVLAFAGSLEA